MATIDIQTLHDLLRCDADAGVLYWKETRGSAAVGDVAGYLGAEGYLRVRVSNTESFAHRIVWAMHYGEWPEGRLDHVNGDRSDNRIANLRPATVAENARNCKRPKHNTSGFKGACLHKKTGKFQAAIRVNKRTIYLGLFPTAEEAHAAYVSAAIKYHGDFHNTGASA